jgi:RNA polymerase sigma factor (sigma-70 family)
MTEAEVRYALRGAHIQAARFARRFHLPAGIDAEELESAAVLGVARAAGAYDPGRQKSFTTFAWDHARWEILFALRRKAGAPLTVSLDALSLDGEPWEEARGATDPGFDRIVLREMLAPALAELPAPLAEVIRLRYLAGLSRRETAERLGLGPTGVDHRERQGLRTLREWLEK